MLLAGEGSARQGLQAVAPNKHEGGGTGATRGPAQAPQAGQLGTEPHAWRPGTWLPACWAVGQIPQCHTCSLGSKP